MATKFSGYFVLENKQAVTAANAFAERWCSWAGVPEKVYHDQGSEFAGAFSELVERWGAVAEVTPTEASWQAGTIERHGGVLEDILRLAVEKQHVEGLDEMRLTALFAAQAKNRRVDRTGHSARERVFGAPECLPGSAVDPLLVQENPAQDMPAMHDDVFCRSLAI